MNFKNYKTGGFHDELFEGTGIPRPSAKLLVDRINSMPPRELRRRQEAAELALLNMGITFNVASGSEGVERIWPFDLIPRIIEAAEWQVLERGLKQRVRALNEFLNDVYNGQKILKDGVVPSDLVLSAASYRKECAGFRPPQGIWCHITGTDLVRDRDGRFYVLEDNLRCPSGVSYVIENRLVMKRVFPSVFEASRVRPVDDYPTKLIEMLDSISPVTDGASRVALLSPGIHNSAYFEHTFLAQQMGIPLVEGRDLVAREGGVYMRTTRGPERIDVLYRRLDDTFLDPEVFNPDSLLGVRGLFGAYRSGKIALANAPGTGIADDKLIYRFVPEIIRYYLGEDAVIPNVPTYLCTNDKDREHVLANLAQLVVKSANEAGGYGMLVGPASTKKQRADFARRIRATPRNFMAQPVVALSRVPTLVGGRTFEGRHVDLRPYILYGKDIYVLPGGLTRVALKKGSLVVNSSQGGGSKDTWIVEAGDTC